jgi:hypothetical protein
MFNNIFQKENRVNDQKIIGEYEQNEKSYAMMNSK